MRNKKENWKIIDILKQFSTFKKHIKEKLYNQWDMLVKSLNLNKK